MSKRYKVGILCQYPFPVGMAPTTRIISYGKGLIQNGAEVEVYSFTWSRDDSIEPLEGEIEGIKYIIPCRYHTKKGRLYHVLVDKFNIYYGTFSRIKDSHNKRPFDCILISFDKISDYRFFLPLLSYLNIPLVFIGDEFPRPIRMLKKRIPWWDKIRFKYYHRFFCKRVLMTNTLKDYYNQEISLKPTYILNSVLDESRFYGLEKNTIGRPYLCYMGNMQLKKDNVDNIIKAFSLIAPDYPEYDLYLYGTPSIDDMRIIESCIIQTAMQERVFIKGRINYSDVPQVLVNSSLLVTSQPNTKRAEGGFPTKMGEYMMTHTPMLVTDVGEIRQYVQDGVNTFMVAPCDPLAYAAKLRYILSHPDEAQQVADNAYKYAISHFASRVATRGLLSFLSSNNDEQ